MKSYIAELLQLINQRIVPNETNLLRLEGVEDPYIYLKIYESGKCELNGLAERRVNCPFEGGED